MLQLYKTFRSSAGVPTVWQPFNKADQWQGKSSLPGSESGVGYHPLGFQNGANFSPTYYIDFCSFSAFGQKGQNKKIQTFRISLPHLLKTVLTLDYRMKVPHVIKVPQPNGGCKIVLYDFLIEIRLSEMNSLLHFCTSFQHSISNS